MSEKGKIFVHSTNSNGRKVVTVNGNEVVEQPQQTTTRIETEIRTNINGGKVFTHPKRNVQFNYNDAIINNQISQGQEIDFEIDLDTTVYDDKIVYNSEIPYVVHTKANKKIETKKVEEKLSTEEKNQPKPLSLLRKKFLNNPAMVLNDILNNDTNFDEFQIFPIFSSIIISKGSYFIKLNNDILYIEIPIANALIYLINTVLNAFETISEEMLIEALIYSFENNDSFEDWLVEMQDLISGMNTSY